MSDLAIGIVGVIFAVVALLGFLTLGARKVQRLWHDHTPQSVDVTMNQLTVTMDEAQYHHARHGKP